MKFTHNHFWLSTDANFKGWVDGIMHRYFIRKYLSKQNLKGIFCMFCSWIIFFTNFLLCSFSRFEILMIVAVSISERFRFLKYGCNPARSSEQCSVTQTQIFFFVLGLGIELKEKENTWLPFCVCVVALDQCIVTFSPFKMLN